MRGRGLTDEDRSGAMWLKRVHLQTSPKSNASTATKRDIFLEIAPNLDARISLGQSPPIYFQKQTEKR